VAEIGTEVQKPRVRARHRNAPVACRVLIGLPGSSHNEGLPRVSPLPTARESVSRNAEAARRLADRSGSIPCPAGYTLLSLMSS
jgi:hypothetical protein